MKKLLILLFSILISFNSYGEWTKVSTTVSDTNIYVDTDTINEVRGYVYVWTLTDAAEPSQSGHRSVKVYEQVDCELNRYKRLTYVFYKQSMGLGESETLEGDGNWKYMVPDTSAYSVMKYACDYVK